VQTEDGRSFAPLSAWMQADDGFDRLRVDFETHYFHSDGPATLTVPAGRVSVTAWRGLENAIARAETKVAADGSSSLKLTSTPLTLPKDWSREWSSGDLHVHITRAAIGPRRDTRRPARAEDLDVVPASS
jgi:hypothetical protein